MGCGASQPFRIPGLTESTRVSTVDLVAEFEASKEAKELIKEHFLLAMEQRPDIFHKTWVKAIRKSIRMNEIIALGKYCVRDLTKWPKLHSLSIKLKAFFTTLIVDYDFDSPKMVAACRELGSNHYQYSEFEMKQEDSGMQPVHFDIWVLSLTEMLNMVKVVEEKKETKETKLDAVEEVKEVNGEAEAEKSKKEKALEAWEDFLKFVSQQILIGYSKTRREEEARKRAEDGRLSTATGRLSQGD